MFKLLKYNKVMKAQKCSEFGAEPLERNIACIFDPADKYFVATRDTTRSNQRYVRSLIDEMSELYGYTVALC